MHNQRFIARGLWISKCGICFADKPANGALSALLGVYQRAWRRQGQRTRTNIYTPPSLCLPRFLIGGVPHESGEFYHRSCECSVRVECSRIPYQIRAPRDVNTQYLWCKDFVVAVSLQEELYRLLRTYWF